MAFFRLRWLSINLLYINLHNNTSKDAQRHHHLSFGLFKKLFNLSPCFHFSFRNHHLQSLSCWFLNISLSEYHFWFLFSFIALYQVLPQQSGFHLMCIFTCMPCVHTHTHTSSSLTPLSIPYWMFLFTKVHLPTTRVLTWIPPYHFLITDILLLK